MHTTNPVLNFIFHVSEAARYLWDCYQTQLIAVSWKKFLLLSLLALLLSSLILMTGVVWLVVLASLFVKLWLPAKPDILIIEPDQNTQTDKHSEE